MVFSKWFSRYKDVFMEDAKQLSENTKSQQEAEIRQRLITILDRDHKAGKTVSLQQLHQECENFLSLKRDSEVVAGTMKLVEATSVQKRKEIECWNCEGKHRASGCQAKPWFCKKCRKVGHKEKFCDTLRQKKTASRTEATQKTQHTKEKFSRNRNNRGPRKQVRIVKIANAAVQANSSRVYIDAVVNNYSIYGKLKCKITMKGVTTEGDAYVTPHSSLLGLEWIRANENLMYHIEMMAEVKANCNPRRKEELKKTLKRGIRNLKGEEKLSEDTFNVIRQAHRTTPHRCLEDRTESLKSSNTTGETVLFRRKFHKGRRRNAAERRKPHTHTWKQGVVAKRLGKVNYEVPVEGRLMRKHANQLRHSNTRTSWNRVDKSLKTLLDMLEVDDNWLKSNDDTASDLD
ncbi:hypothetical protein COOONC_19606, partial [Cooperia oncophora]